MSTTWFRRMEGTIETGSRIKVWWLSTFQGLRVFEEKLSPRKGSFGRISWHRVWLLKPKED